MMFVSINPATGETIARYAAHDGAGIEKRLEDSWRAWLDWRQTGIEDRTDFLERLAALLDDRAERYGAIISREMGKPLREAVAEVQKCATTARHYAAQGPGYLAANSVGTEARRTEVAFEPLGPVLAVMPWNFPFWQVIRFFVPAALAGNVALLKHAENVQGCAQAVEEVVAEAAGRPNLLYNLAVHRDAVAGLIADARVRAVTLTGSVRAGRSVAAAAGAAGKKAVLELGGSDPFIVLADADLDRAVSVALTSRFANAGQSCISAKRFIVASAIADRFVDAFADGARALRLGDPLDPKTTMGPMAREDLRDGFAAQVRGAIAAGARAVVGGRPVEGPGFFFEPTVLVDVDPHSAAGQEEMFGPAAAVFTFDTVDEAVTLANGTAFGLGAALWTGDAEGAGAIANRIEAGAVFVNDLVRSDPRVPFGGIKDSGYGRELGELGIREFTNAKLKWIA